MAVVAQRSETGRPVSRVLAPVIWRLGTLVAVMAAICVVGVLLSMQAVRSLPDKIEPASRSHAVVVQDMNDLEAQVSAWARSGNDVWRIQFAGTSTELVTDIAALRGYTDGNADLDVVVAPELTSARAWLTAYARPRIAADGGPATYQQQRFENGQALFEQFRRARERTDASFVAVQQQAGDAAMLRFRLTVVAALLVLGLSWILIGRSRARLLAELSEPLLALEKVVQRMLKNDPEGRAAANLGPKEVRAIARALNYFAEAQSLARAVEGRIQDELHVLDSAKDDFVSNVSHELRTPLTTISGYLEMVADEFEGRIDPRHDRMLEATRRNVTRLRALIDDLLALSKAEQRSAELEPSDVVEMVMEAVTDVRMTASRRGISVDVAAPDEPMLVVSDRAMLYRAFLNVLTNAVKFSHDDGSVEVGVKRVLNRVEISIRDHGIGIPKAELDRLGTRFFRASNAMTNEIAGTGLGLRIVQTIIDKHAGDVIIESAEGEGTTVFIRLRLHGERVGRLGADGLVEPSAEDDTDTDTDTDSDTGTGTGTESALPDRADESVV
ncbi:hypothetical protein BH11ACT8_BH11ACT8_35510 [soil metagenome]